MSRAEQPFDIVEKAKHYNVHASGHEAIELLELLNSNLGNALKYCWRTGKKGDSHEAIDLGKARWYARRHCDSVYPVPLFATTDLLEKFVRLAADVIRHEQPHSLLSVTIAALAAGEPRRMLQRIEEELATLEEKR